MKIKIEIDGKKIATEPGTMIIEAADNNGVHIPRFCYHRKLSIAANCRMCLVEVENARKPMPACATPITDGMKVFTQSEAARHSQKTVMEFLLINHPLDCPICDQGGQCELQDVAMGYGQDLSRYTQGKRVVKDKSLGSLVGTDMTRCIHCTRCVRFSEEIAGLPEMGAPGRGEHTEIGTYIEKSLTSELSGNIIDLCPVGALTSKPFRFQARAWEMTERTSIAPHDCVGSHVACHTLHNNVMRVVPAECESLNEIWLSDRDRFSYLGLNSDDRQGKPKIKENGRWRTVDWPTALNKVVNGLSQTIQSHGVDAVGMLASPLITLEEAYLLQKISRHMGINNIDHRVRETDFSDQDAFGHALISDVSIKDIQNQEAILLLGVNVCREQPMIGNRVRKATRRGYPVMSINPMRYESHFPMQTEEIVPLSDLPQALACVAKVLLSDLGIKTKTVLDGFIAACKPQAVHKSIAAQLISAPHKLIILGETALLHPQAGLIRTLASIIKTYANVGLMYLTQGGNSQGAWLAGLLPHRKAAGLDSETVGMHAGDLFEKPRKAYCFFQLDPELDCNNPQQVSRAVTDADFVVAMAPFCSGLLDEQADVFLPIAPFTETSGTFVNLEGHWQRFAASVKPYDASRPGWKVLRVLGNLINMPDCEYQSSEEICDELRALVKANERTATFDSTKPVATPATTDHALQRLGTWPLYGVDNLVRRADALQIAGSSDGKACVRMALQLSEQLGVKDGDNVIVTQQTGQAELPVTIDANVPDHSVVIHSGYAETATLGDALGFIKIEKKV